MKIDIYYEEMVIDFYYARRHDSVSRSYKSRELYKSSQERNVLGMDYLSIYYRYYDLNVDMDTALVALAKWNLACHLVDFAALQRVPHPCLRSCGQLQQARWMAPFREIVVNYYQS